MPVLLVDIVLLLGQLDHIVAVLHEVAHVDTREDVVLVQLFKLLHSQDQGVPAWRRA